MPKVNTSVYLATVLLIRWAQVKTTLTVLHFACTSSYITCRRFSSFYGETLGSYGQFDGHLMLFRSFDFKWCGSV